LQQLFTDYLRFLEEDARREPATISNVRRSLRKLDDWLDGRDAALITSADLKLYVRHLLKTYKRSTVSKDITSINASYRFAREAGEIDANPCYGLRKMLPSGSDFDPKTFSKDELLSILAACRDDRDRLIVYVLAFTGTRSHEARALRWTADGDKSSWVDFDNDQLVIYGKGRKRRRVPLHPILRTRLLRERQRHGGHHEWVFVSQWNQRIARTTWNKVVNALMKRAGIQEKASHVFRKTLSTDLNRRGVRGDVIDRIFGWSPSDVRSRYYTGLADDDMRAAIALAYADDVIFPEQPQLEPTGKPRAEATELSDPLALKVELARLENENLRLRAALAGVELAA